MITTTDVQKIAKLAKLGFHQAELERFTGKMANILQFVEKLNQLDLTGIEATSHAVEITNVFREDRTLQSQVCKKALDKAPARDENFFRVPKII